VHHVLFYDYVPDVLERRGAHRDAHLARLREQQRAGRVVMAGALGDPPRGAAIVFEGAEPAEIEEFARQDPYVVAGLVTGWRVEPWMLV
jgi:hypothetical protein